jgi:hypothetical protein
MKLIRSKFYLDVSTSETWGGADVSDASTTVQKYKIKLKL